MLTVTGLSRSFNRRLVFRDLTFSVASPGSLAVTGKNGAGKSTLVKILAGIASPTNGTVAYTANGGVVSPDAMRERLGFVSSYLNLYDEFTARENLSILGRIRTGAVPTEQSVADALHRVDLWQRRDDLVSSFSSGMTQRLKYALAILHVPEVLILDEPTANLDTDGIELVKEIVRFQQRQGILIVATNDEEESSWCLDRVHLAGRGTDTPS